MENELETIKSAQKGNTASFGLLYDAYIQKIYRFIFFKTRHKETAEDLTSEVFTKVLTKLTTFDENKASFSIWIYQIARNTVIDYYRAKKDNLNIEDAWDLASDENVVQNTASTLELRKIESYLKTLKHDQRDLVILRVWQDLSYKEISTIMGKNEGSLRVSFGRIIKNMKNDLGPNALLVIIAMRSNLYQ